MEWSIFPIIVSKDLASTNPKEVGFQIMFLNCCKEATMLLKNALHFYGQCQS